MLFMLSESKTLQFWKRVVRPIDFYLRIIFIVDNFVHYASNLKTNTASRNIHPLNANVGRPSGNLQVRTIHSKWFTTLILHVFLKLLIGIVLHTHIVFPIVKFTEKITFFPKKV